MEQYIVSHPDMGKLTHSRRISRRHTPHDPAQRTVDLPVRADVIVAAGRAAEDTSAAAKKTTYDDAFGGRRSLVECGASRRWRGGRGGGGMGETTGAADCRASG